MKNRRYRNKMLNKGFRSAVLGGKYTCTKRVRKEAKKILRKGEYKRNKKRNIWNKIERRSIKELGLSRELYNSLTKGNVKSIGNLIWVLDTGAFNFDFAQVGINKEVIEDEFGYDTYAEELTPEEIEIENKYYAEAEDKLYNKMHLVWNGYGTDLDRKYYKF